MERERRFVVTGIAGGRMLWDRQVVTTNYLKACSHGIDMVKRGASMVFIGHQHSDKFLHTYQYGRWDTKPEEVSDGTS